MKEKHKWHDVIVAWSTGEPIQYKCKEYPKSLWVDFMEDEDETYTIPTPFFNDERYLWRIKPKTIKYRLSYMKHHDGSFYIDVLNSHFDYTPKGNYNFVDWVTDDWVEFQVPELVNT